MAGTSKAAEGIVGPAFDNSQARAGAGFAALACLPARSRNSSYTGAMTEPILLCCDLDRTLLPNGPQPESPAARPTLRSLAERPELHLVYVSGRSERLLDEAIATWELPEPTLAVGDVGSTVLQRVNGLWQPVRQWWDEIAPAWNGYEARELHAHLAGEDGLRLQEVDRQNRFKLSYYTAPDLEPELLRQRIAERLGPLGVHASVIWSVDELESVGLLDVLPETATKLHAVQFVSQQLGVGLARTVFAGDSGNDLPALTSGLQAVLVANASPQVRKAAVDSVTQRGFTDTLYLAQGAFDMNGNYAAGALEGLAHFLPETRPWIESAIAAGT